jgi:hypothetical protein
MENALLLKELEFFNEYMITGGNYESDNGSNDDLITPHMVFLALNERRQVNAMDLMTNNERNLLLKSSEGPLMMNQIKSSP